jgi:serine/threonine protein kinase
VHRDIKPENIMLSSRGEVKVADFGLARIADDDSLNLTRVGITMGTPLYMSPEQVEGRRVDHRSDLYSLGVTAYHMLAGRPPFDGNTALNVAVQHLQTEPTPLATHRSDLPEEFCAIVHKLLAKQPDDRFQSASELLGELRHLASTVTDDGWDAELANWSAAELAALPDPRFESTRQLATLLHEQATMELPIVTPTWWVRVAGGIAASFVVGALLAWLTK